MGNQALYALGIPVANGQPAQPAFDAQKQKFNYRVNTKETPVPIGNPYQVQLALRYSF